MGVESLLQYSEREELGIPEWLSDTDAQAKLTARVRPEMTWTTPQVLECVLRITNPFVIGRLETLRIDGKAATDSIYAKAREDVLAEHGLDTHVDIYNFENGDKISFDLEYIRPTSWSKQRIHEENQAVRQSIPHHANYKTIDDRQHPDVLRTFTTLSSHQWLQLDG